MRIVCNINILVVTFCFVGLAMAARAADTPFPPPPVLAAPTVNAQPVQSPALQKVASATPSLPSPIPAASKADTEMASADSSVTTPAIKSSTTGGGLNAAENKLPDSVKDVLKRLDKPTDDVTLDDLNSARQAVAKIEILIELEKHLVELDKLRHERDKETSLATMIPASALQAPSYSPPPLQSAQNQAPIVPKEAVEVTQISGGGGHYSAAIKMSGDESKTVHVGDHLPDGSAVIEISSTDVVLERNGAKRMLHIKNIDTVFSNSF